MSDKIKAIDSNGQDRPLKPGEKETKLAFEEATRKNILMIVMHGNETRAIVKKHEEEIMRMRNIIIMQEQKIDQLRKLIVQGLQQKIAGGSTDEDK